MELNIMTKIQLCQSSELFDEYLEYREFTRRMSQTLGAGDARF